MITETTLYVAGIIFIAGFLQTLTGFGYAMAAAPLLALFLKPQTAVMYVLLTGLFMKAYMAYKTRKEADMAAVLPMFGASVIGAIPGSYLLKVLDPAIVKIMIGAVLILATGLMYFQVKITIEKPRTAEKAVGFASGFLGSTTSMSGPPLVLYMLNNNESAIVMRANLALYFILTNIVYLLFAYGVGTLVNLPAMMTDTLVCLPVMYLSFVLGDALFRRMNVEVFRQMGLAIIALSSAALLVSGVFSLKF
jgi:uncharacterized membrane protein YfcA